MIFLIAASLLLLLDAPPDVPRTVVDLIAGALLAASVLLREEPAA